MQTLLNFRSSLRSVTGALAMATALAATASSAVSQQPDVIYVTGTVRDFMQSHPDFGVADTGHVANNIALTAADNRPAFNGHGWEVSTQWRNKSGHNIPPHHFFNGSVLLLGSSPDYNPNKAYIDSWDSSEGPYGGSNVGPAPPVVVTTLPPVPSPPTNLPNGNGHFSGTNNVISSSFQTTNFITEQYATVQIAPDTTVTIYVTNAVAVGRFSKIIVPEGSKLILYFAGNFDIGQGGEINMTNPLDPARCWIYNLGTSTMVFNQDGKVCAKLFSPNGGIHLKQNDEFYGTIVAQDLKMDQGGALHFDGIPGDMCGETLADLAGVPANASWANVTSQSTFNQWFTNVLGVNAAVAHTIALHKNASGVYEYNDNAFFPIDDLVFGNEGEEHNFYFTFTFSASFIFDACAGLFFEFQGADDAWVFIDGKLALDLGGVMPMAPQRAELDRLDLTHGETYTLHFFFAQRNPSMSVMNIKTNVPLQPGPVVTMSALYD